LVEGNILHDLAIVIICAGIVTFIFRLLKLPLLLGYLISGLLVGPNFLPQSPIHDLEAIRSLSELGVIFLMFYIGLEFDLAKLKRIMGPAVIAVAFQTTLMVFIGIMVAPLLGWSSINGLFLGCLLAISSTMITIPILREQKSLKANFAQVAIGILVLEDILAIIVLVVLTGVGISGHFAWGAVGKVIFLVGIFVVMVYFIGKLIAPKLLNLLKKFESPEVLTIVTIAVVLGVGELADHYNFSIALGAFLAGSIISQQPLAIEIEHAIEPLRNLFTAVFFVTVGMLIDPKLLLEYWGTIVFLTGCVVVGKTISIWWGLFLTGEKPKTGFRAALCKAQIGEFSFVIAALGIQYNVTEPALMTLAVGVSLGSIIVVPILVKHSIPIYNTLADVTPKPLRSAAEFYNTFLTIVKNRLSRNSFLRLLSRPAAQIISYFLLFNGVIVIAFLSSQYVENSENLANYEILIKNLIWLAAALGCLPFLIAIIRNLDFVLMLIIQTVFSINTRKQFTQGRLVNVLSSGILCIVLITFGGLYLSVAAAYLPSGVALAVFVGLVIAMSLFFWRHIIKINSRLEYLFIESFNTEIQSTSEDRRDSTLKEIKEKYPWPVTLYDIILPEGSSVSGKSIAELNLRHKTGASIIGLNRGKYTIYDPSPDAPLFPGDHIILLGNEDQKNQAMDIFNEQSREHEVARSHSFEIEQIFVQKDSLLDGSTLADANLRREHGINVIGIQRGEDQITAPLPEETVKADDVLMVVGNPLRIEKFREQIAG